MSGNRAPEFRPFIPPVCVSAPARRAGGRAYCFAQRLRAAGGAAALALVMGSACGAEQPPTPPIEIDAGPDCERGSRNCPCIGGTRCGAGLVCLVGRCSLALQEPEDEPSRPRPRPPNVDRPELDAGGAPALDAGAPDASSAEPDASAPGDGSAVDAGN